MRYTTIILTTLTTSVLAMPTTPAPPKKCTYGTWQCATPPTGIQVCDWSGTWQNVGPCAAGETCQLVASGAGMLPYCVATPPVSTTCTKPGTYDCQGKTAMRVCDTSGKWVKVGDCPTGTHCGFLSSVPGVPYCLA